MSEAIQIRYESIGDAAASLTKLLYKLDAHQMYTGAFAQSRGDARDQMGYLSDELNAVKTTLGRLIDGTRIKLSAANKEFKAADERAVRECEKIRIAQMDTGFAGQFDSGTSMDFKVTEKDGKGAIKYDGGRIEATITKNGETLKKKVLADIRNIGQEKKKP
ncbi:MAG: hypothetical protein LBU07_05505 [Coriobacteriales bacterium]|nr:hypothetical protein [Coriobacteriales bacterium]